MTRAYCWVSGCCTGHDNRGRRLRISIFRFPPDDKQLKLWMTTCRIPEIYTKLSKDMRICSRHFEQRYVELGTGGRFKLTKDAFPTLFRWNDYSSPNGKPAFDPKSEMEYLGRVVPGKMKVLRPPDSLGECPHDSQGKSPAKASPRKRTSKRKAALEQPVETPVVEEIPSEQPSSDEAAKKKLVYDPEPCQACVEKACSCLDQKAEEKTSDNPSEPTAPPKKVRPLAAKKLRVLQNRHRRALKKMAAMEEELKKFRKMEKHRGKSWSEVLEESFDPVFAGLLKRVVAEKKSFTKEEKQLSTDLYRKTITGYEWVRQYVPLPNTRTIRKWLHAENCAGSKGKVEGGEEDEGGSLTEEPSDVDEQMEVLIKEEDEVGEMLVDKGMAIHEKDQDFEKEVALPEGLHVNDSASSVETRVLSIS